MDLLFINHHRRSKTDIRSGAFARELVSRGHKVTLIVVSDNSKFLGREYFLDGVRFIESPDLFYGRLRSGWDPYCALRRLVTLLNEDGKYDLIHLFGTRPATIIPSLIYLKFHPTPLVLDWEDWWGRGGLINYNRPNWYKYTFSHVEVFFEEYFRPYADGQTVLSPALAHRAEGLGIHPETIFILLTVPSERCFCDLTVVEAKQKAGLEPAYKYIGFASLDSFLDIDLVLKSVKEVVAKDSQVRLLLTGRINNVLETLLENLELNSYCTKLGFLDEADYANALSACNLLLLPFPDNVSNRGRWPSKLASYLLTNRYILTNDVGWLKLLKDNFSNIIITDYSKDGFVKKINELLKKDDSDFDQLSTNKSKFLNMFGLSKQISNLEQFYLKCMKRFKSRKEGKREKYIW